MRGLIIIGCTALAAVFASCAQQVSPIISQQPVGNITSYFWWNSEAPMPFEDTSTHLPLTLSFANNAQGMLAVSVFPPLFSPIDCIVNEDSVYATGFSHGSTIDLAPGSYFSSDDTEVLVSQPPNAVVTTDGSHQVIVATDSGVYFSSGGAAFQLGGLYGENITALTLNSKSSLNVFAGTSTGKIYRTTAPLSTSSTWALYPYSLPVNGAIGQLLYLSGDSIATIVSGQPGIYISTLGPWTQPTYLSGSKVRALGKFSVSVTSYLLAATTDGYIGAHSLNSFGTDVTPMNMTAAGNIYCFSASPYQTVAGTDGGVYQWSGPSSNTWTPVQKLANYKPVTSLALDADTLIFVSKGIIDTAELGTNGTSGGPRLPIDKDSAVQVGWTSSLPWAITTKGYEASTTPGSSLALIPGLPIGFCPDDTGGLLLLRSNLFANDSSWRAGTLVTVTDSSYPITAHVLAHLDSLHISGIAKSFPDVIMVRYSYEVPGEKPASFLPYWIVYYAKNEGPVMFDNFLATGSLYERWSIQP